MGIVCDVNKLPEDVRAKAHEYVEKRKPQFKTIGMVYEDVEHAWLKGFAFCLEWQVDVKVEQCVTCGYWSSYVYDLNARNKVLEAQIEELKKRAGNLVYCIENCAKNKLAIARHVEQLKICLN